MTNASTLPAPVAREGQDCIHTLPILVLFPHNRCNCRCVMCDIWRIRQTREITACDLQPHLESIRALRVRWVVFSGGEPQMHTDLAALSGFFRAEGIRITLLTAGLLLHPFARAVADTIDDVIVSLDGPPQIHDRIRRIPGACDKMTRGVQELHRLRPQMAVRGRSTIQKANFAYLRETLRAAKQIGLNSISFLAADLTSEAFNRPGEWPPERQASIALDDREADDLEREIELLVQEHRADIESGYVAEDAPKLRRIVRHFRSHLGQTPAVSPACNAPWVSAVIEADGAVRPCFFHRPLGNIHEAPLLTILNSGRAIEFRRELDIANNPVCRRCVCSLRLPSENPPEPR